jgi:sarcosine oxidase / L-pipecolate oxidase
MGIRYAAIDVFDKWPVPSRDAASTDTAKVVRADYTDAIYAKIGMEAIELWNTELYHGTYHQTGFDTPSQRLMTRVDSVE